MPDTPAVSPAQKPKAAPAPRPPKPKAEAPATPKPKAEAPATPKPTPASAAAAPVAPVPIAPAPPTAPRSDATVVDVSGLVLGRAASVIAKRLLDGESIVVVNAEKSVVTGSRSNVLSFYVANRARGSKRTGPHFPRYPDRIFRRTVRGMVPHLKTRGKEALDRLDVFIGVPSEYSGSPRASIEQAKAQPALRAPMTLGEISRLLGARV